RSPCRCADWTKWLPPRNSTSSMSRMWPEHTIDYRGVLMFKNKPDLQQVDGEVSAAIGAEQQRQEAHVELIASENYTSPNAMAAQGSVLTNKYAEGYPGKRYYGGCEHVDVVEQLAIDRARALFGADYANVQPHSGAQAKDA